jgi:hypothetical protein
MQRLECYESVSSANRIYIWILTPVSILFEPTPSGGAVSAYLCVLGVVYAWFVVFVV